MIIFKCTTAWQGRGGFFWTGRSCSYIPTNVPFYHALEQKVSQLTGLEKTISDYVAEHDWEEVTLDRLAGDRKAYDLVCCTAPSATATTRPMFEQSMIKRAVGCMADGS